MRRIGEAEVRWVDSLRNSAAADLPLAVGDVVPAGYDHYIRIMHPAQWSMGDVVLDISWQEVAARTGRHLNALSRFDDLIDPRTAAADDVARPLEGQLSDDLCERLVLLLANETLPSVDCVFMFASSWSSMLPRGEEFASVHLSDGEYIYAASTIDDVCEFSISPTFWWPADRSWIVVTQVDTDSTFVGCSAIVERLLLADRHVEAWPVRRHDLL
jgi:hypothetical protein